MGGRAFGLINSLDGSKGHKNVVELLLAYKAEINAKNNNGETPLFVTATSNHKDIAELLRQHGGHE